MKNQDDSKKYSLEELIKKIKENKWKIKEILKEQIEKPIEEFKIIKPREIIEEILGQESIKGLDISRKAHFWLDNLNIETIGQFVELDEFKTTSRAGITTVNNIRKIQETILSEIDDVRKMQDTFVEQLAKKFRINEEKIRYILNKYGTMQEFLNANREGKLDLEDKKVLKNNLKKYLDIADEKDVEYINLGKEIWYGEGLNENNFVIRNSALLKGIVSTLEPFEYEIIKAKFGLDGEEKKSTKELAQKMGLSYNKVDSIRKTALKKIQKLAKTKEIDLKEIKSNDQLENIKTRFFNSNAIFYPDEQYENEPSNFEYSELQKNVEEILIKENEEKEKAIRKKIEEGAKEGKSKKEIAIEVLSLLNTDDGHVTTLGLNGKTINALYLSSVRTHNLPEFLELDDEDFYKIRGAGETFKKEVKDKQQEIILEFSDIENLPQIISKFSHLDVITGSYNEKEKEKVKESKLEKTRKKAEAAKKRVEDLKKQLAKAEEELKKANEEVIRAEKE